MKQQLAYKRILLKLSGEALKGDDSSCIDLPSLKRVVLEVKDAVSFGAEVAIVMGAGNIIRGATLCAKGMGRVTSDNIGMLATVINALALCDEFDRNAVPCELMSARPIPGLIAPYNARLARSYLAQGKVLLLAGGTGNPLVTTDSAAALRGVEIGADILLKSTKVDGVYAADPVLNPDAERFDHLTYDEVLQQELEVMDLHAVLLCRDNELPLRIFNMNEQGALARVLDGHDEGTLVELKEKDNG